MRRLTDRVCESDDLVAYVWWSWPWRDEQGSRFKLLVVPESSVVVYLGVL